MNMPKGCVQSPNAAAASGLAVVEAIVRDKADQPWVRVQWYGKLGV